MSDFENLTKLINEGDLTKIRKYGRLQGFHNIYFRSIIYTKLLLLNDPELKYQSDVPSL